MIEIRNCPHCGGESEVSWNFGKLGYFVWIECSMCGCRTKAYSYGQCLPKDYRNTRGVERLANTWNKRCV